MAREMTVATATPPFSLNLEEAVRAVFRDPEWLKKLAIGALWTLLSMLIIGSLVAQGYLLLYAERVSRAEPRPLPEWDDLGGLLRRGALGFVVALVYVLPLVLAIVVGTIVVVLLLAAAGAGGASGDAIGGIATLAYCGGIALLLPLALLVGIVVPAAQAQLVLHDGDLGAAFRFGEVARFIRRQPGQYGVMIVLSFAVSAALSQVGQLACCIGIFPAAFLAQLFQYHLIGQLCWREFHLSPPPAGGDPPLRREGKVLS